MTILENIEKIINKKGLPGVVIDLDDFLYAVPHWIKAGWRLDFSANGIYCNGKCIWMLQKTLWEQDEDTQRNILEILTKKR